jgi:hypothetical protein
MAEYANYTGWMTVSPLPYICNDTAFYACAFPADRVRCQSFLDRSYNQVAGYQKYRILLDVAFFIALNAQAIRASAPPFSEEGTMAEADLGFWLLAGDYDAAGTLQSIAWVPTYLFVDNPLAVNAGREVLGFPKYSSTVVWPEAARLGDPFEVSTYVIKNFAPTSKATQERLLRLSGKDILAAAPRGSAIDVFRQLSAGADPALLDAVTEGPGAADILPSAVGLPIPVFYLKQARSAASATRACYQEVLRGPLILTALHGVELLPGLWTLDLNDCDSMPFIHDLGLGTPDPDGRLVLTTPLCVWAHIDFTVGRAEPVP